MAGGKWGGARPGAGRKRKAPDVTAKTSPVPYSGRDVLRFLLDVALGHVDATSLQVRAAIAAVQYTHTRKSDGGKKDEAAEKAKKASTGRFAPRQPPLKLIEAHPPSTGKRAEQ